MVKLVDKSEHGNEIDDALLQLPPFIAQLAHLLKQYPHLVRECLAEISQKPA